ncbi:hypothetical protein D918_06947 [Trichuris suis]|nr:hypothetical protein D918_06947 [Trichuris suis]
MEAEQAADVSDKMSMKKEPKPSCLLRFDYLEKALSQAFRVYSTVVSRHPWPFILVPVLLTSIFSVGLLHKNVVIDAIYLYTPLDGISKYEQRVFEETWPLTDGTFQPGRTLVLKRQSQVIVSAKDKGNVLRPVITKAVLRLNDFVMNDIYVS